MKKSAISVPTTETANLPSNNQCCLGKIPTPLESHPKEARCQNACKHNRRFFLRNVSNTTRRFRRISQIKASGFFQDSIDYSTAGLLFISLGKVFFNDATVNADRSVYTFNFDLKKGLDSAFSRDTFAKLPEVLQKMFFSVAKVENKQRLILRPLLFHIYLCKMLRKRRRICEKFSYERSCLHQVSSNRFIFKAAN